MDELDKIIETGQRIMNESLDITEHYFPGAITDISRMILTTIVKTTAQQAYEAGLDKAGRV
jgi:hypothetical protein